MMSRSSINKNITAIKKLAHLGKYQDAAKIADEIRWGRVKDVKTLNMVSDIYEKCERYHDAKRVMMVVYNRVDANKRLLYKMCELSAKAGDFADAEEFYWEFSNLAPKDSGKLILAYHIMRASNEPDIKKIEVLELYIKEDFDEKWAYKLAQLYYKTGQTEKCVRTCDEIILWYSGDRYGAAALRLKHKCLGIEDETVQPEVKTVDAAEAEAYKTEETADNSGTERAEDNEEVSVEAGEDVIMDDEAAEEISAEDSEDEPRLWFDLKSINKDIITREVEEDGAAEFSGRVSGEEEFGDNAADEITEESDNFDCYPTADTELAKEEAVSEETDRLEDAVSEGVSEESCQADAEEVVCGDTAVLERKRSGIVLERSTEREKVFVFDQKVIEEEPESFEEAVELVEETPFEEVIELDEVEEILEEAIEAAEISEDKDIMMFVDDEIFIEADIADSDEEECFTDDMFSEEIFVDEDIADEDAAYEKITEVTLEKKSDITEQITEQLAEEETLTEEAFSEVAEVNTDEGAYSAESAEVESFATEVSPEENEVEEFISEEESDGEELTEASAQENEAEEAMSEESDSEETSTEETCAVVTEDAIEDFGAEDIAFTEAAVTAEAAEDASSDQKVTFVGYIDGENNFKPAAEDDIDAEKGALKKSAEQPIAETAGIKEGYTKSNYYSELKILLIECSQMRGGVKYAANKLHNIHQQAGTKLHGVAKISDTKFSVRGAESAISVLKGRDLIVEGVDGITYETVNELMNLLDEDMKPTILAIVDTPTKLALFINRHRTFASRCEYIYEEASISRREFLNYINNYAYKLDAVLDDMAEEELEYIADEMMEDGIAFTISDAAALVERALEKAQKPGIKGLFEAKKDSDGYLILRARHFDRG